MGNGRWGRKVAGLRAAADEVTSGVPEDPGAMWAALVEGRWSLYDRFHEEGRRCLVARRNDPHHRTSRALSASEREVVGHAARGCANKVIAYAMGLADSTVATHLASAMRKLGVVTRTELVELLADLAPDEPGCAGRCPIRAPRVATGRR